MNANQNARALRCKRSIQANTASSHTISITLHSGVATAARASHVTRFRSTAAAASMACCATSRSVRRAYPRRRRLPWAALAALALFAAFLAFFCSLRMGEALRSRTRR